MSAEVYVSSKALAVRFNGVFSPTDRGHLAHELVRTHKVLESIADPKQEVSFSEEMTKKLHDRREELCDMLGLPSEEKIRERTIQRFSRRLDKVGLPYYKINLR
jgi:hypothetical protein